MRHLPTAGGGPAIIAVLGNNAQLTTQTVQATLSHVKSGKLRALASFGTERSKVLPDVPTMKELGYDVTLLSLGGSVRPEGHASPDHLDAERGHRQGGGSPQFNGPLANIGLEPSYLAATDFAKFWDADIRRAEDTISSDRQGGMSVAMKCIGNNA